MAYRPYRSSTMRRSPAKGRWMDLRFAGKCTAGEPLAAGARAFYDPRDRSVTCTNLDHAEAAGLVRNEWVGSPISGGYEKRLAETRLASFVGEGTPDPTRTYRRSLGGCSHEDYPCCGCG
jgi:hypothetical protein